MKIWAKNITFLSLILLVSACGNQKNQASTGAINNFKLAIVDSIQVDIFANYLSLVDVQDGTGNILALRNGPPTAYILDPKGKVIRKFERPGDDPRGVGNSIHSGEFYEDGVALMGQMRLKTYDMEFKVRKSLKPHYSPTGMFFSGYNHLIEFGNENKQLFAFFGGPQVNTSPLKKEFYEQYNIADIVDPNLVISNESLTTELSNAELFKPIGEFTQDSKYLSGRAFYFITPVFDVKDNDLIYAFKDDTTLYKRQLPSGEMFEQYKIPFDKFINFNGYAMGPAGIAEQDKPSDRSGRILKVFSVDGFDIVNYHSGMKMSEMQKFDKTSPDIRQILAKEDYQKYLILKDGQRMNTRLRIPEKIASLIISDDQGYIWAQKDLSDIDEEPEFITFYKLKVVTD
ncbi:hypothetical protein [Roseivirga sp.]|uniref:hypothetical protein n=1 Tax=Roseivirga sp. TaxID=1964215 RepID=UPI003B8B4BA1